MTANGPTKNGRHKVQVASHTPGRIRIRIHPSGRQPAVMRHIKDKLETREGIHDVKMNEATGSIRINYDPKRHDAAGILRVLEDLDLIVSEYCGGIGIAGEDSTTDRGTLTFSSAVEDLNERLSMLTGTRIDLKDFLPLSLLGIGVWSVARNGLRLAQVPGWVFLWLAFDTYVKLHRPQGVHGMDAAERGKSPAASCAGSP
jgi:hypothetical protein